MSAFELAPEEGGIFTPGLACRHDKPAHGMNNSCSSAAVDTTAQWQKVSRHALTASEVVPQPASWAKGDFFLWRVITHVDGRGRLDGEVDFIGRGRNANVRFDALVRGVLAGLNSARRRTAKAADLLKIHSGRNYLLESSSH